MATTYARLSRRLLLLTLLVAVAGAPLNASSEERTYRIAVLGYNVSVTDDSMVLKQLKAGLAERGYVEGRNLVFERRYARRDRDLLMRQAQELLAWKPDVIIGADSTTGIALKAATAESRTPVVTWSLDPVSSGIVADFDRPGGNITGFAEPADTQLRQIRLLVDVVPGIRSIGVLYNPTYGPAAGQLSRLRASAETLGVKLEVFEALKMEDLEPAIAAMSKAGVGGFVIGPHSLFSLNGETIGKLALKYQLPAVTQLGSVLQGGGLAAFSPPFSSGWYNAAALVDKILTGVNPGEIPIDRSSRGGLTVNLVAATELGLQVPPSVLAEADRVIR